jgi:hypothetical protein
LLGGFAVLALVLAIIGLYGLLSFTVTQRQREIGVRMALGAQRFDVLNLVVGQGMRLVLTGVFIGLLGSFALTRVLTSVLFKVEPTDPLTFVTVTLSLCVVALLACYIPARRATRIDPMVALRKDIEAGKNPKEARFAALRQFGWTESIKEDCREQRGVRWLEHLVQDVRYGSRSTDGKHPPPDRRSPVLHRQRFRSSSFPHEAQSLAARA